jgi:hypothetical protein
MLRLKKKKEKEKTDAATTGKATESGNETTSTASSSTSNSPTPMDTDKPQVSLLGGIGGKKVNKVEGQKKRTPGEIRIQKGKTKHAHQSSLRAERSAVTRGVKGSDEEITQELIQTMI